MNELTAWLDTQRIQYEVIDKEVVDISGFGKLFFADLSGVKSIFRQQGDQQVFNLMEDPQTLMDEGIFHVAFPFGRNWYYYDLRDEFTLNILKYIGQPKRGAIDTPFVNLGVHTPFELLNAAGDITQWIAKAKWLGHSAIGICDRNTLGATLIFQKECEKARIKHVFGYSLTLDFDGEDVDLKVYCQTQSGLQNLLHIQKEIMVDREDGKIDLRGLMNHAAGNVLVFGTLSAYWMAGNRHVVEDLRRVFGKIYYQFDPSEFKAERVDVRYLNNLRHFFHHFQEDGSFDVEPVLISDSYYLDKDDWNSKIVLNKVATGAAHDQSEKQYFKGVEDLFPMVSVLFDPLQWEVEALFEHMCRNTIEIANGADVRYELKKLYSPRYDMRPEEVAEYGDRRNMFHRLLKKGLEAKIPECDHPAYRERLREELYIVESTDNLDYFLILWDMVQEAKRRGIVTGIGRGSAGGSLVSYLLDIISIDPIKYGLLFSRFLVPERCGLQWRDNVTAICGELPLPPDSRYVEFIMDGKCHCFDKDAQFRVIRDGEEVTVYADELRADDEIIIDNRDLIWTLKEVR